MPRALSSRLRPGSEQGDGRNGDPLRKDAPGFPHQPAADAPSLGHHPSSKWTPWAEFKFRKSVPSVHVHVHTRAHVCM